MAKNANVGKAHAFYDALAGNDEPAAAAGLDEASLLHVSGRSGLAGDYQGREAILGLSRRMSELTGGTFRFTQSKVVADDDQAMVRLGHVSATREGKRLDTDVVHVVSLRNGRAREIWIFHQDQRQVDDFWL